MIKSVNKKTKKEGFVQYTHANNSGQITTFFYSAKGCCSPRSFNLSEFDNVIDFLNNEYPNFTFIEVE